MRLDSDEYQMLWKSADADSLERRFFPRVRVNINGELLWATKKMLGRVANHREFLITHNVSRDGARVILDGHHHFPVGARARLKLGIEFCEVEILGVQRADNADKTSLRLTFIGPNPKFMRVVEQYLPIGDERMPHETKWAGL